MSTAYREVYLDNNARTRPLPEVIKAVMHTMAEGYGNPSSPHRRGSVANAALELARQQVADLVNCDEESVIFTSGGTEANNLVLQSLCAPGGDARLVTSAVEHSSVLKPAQVLEQGGKQVDILAVDQVGRVCVEQLGRMLEQPANLVSIQWASSETGTIQPVEEIGAICQQREVPFHVDAAQAIGRLPVDFKSLPADYLTLSSHKIHGPQGAGAVCAKAPSALASIMQGGDQEQCKRPGTENLPGIVGLGKAMALRAPKLDQCIAAMKGLRDSFEQKVLNGIPDAGINGDPDHRTVNSTNILFPGIDGMAMMAQLDSAGICCSLTSACTSARPEPSHVLLAMGLAESDAYSSLRFSFSVLNDEQDVDVAAAAVHSCYDRLVKLEAQFG